MKVWICTKVVDCYAGAEEPICETRIALSPEKACAELYDLVGEEPVAMAVEPYGLAEELSEDDRHFYVEEHELKVENVALALIAAETQELLAKLSEPVPKVFTGGAVPVRPGYLVGENPCAQFVPRSLLCKPDDKPEGCRCQPGRCMAHKAAWCIDSPKRDAQPVVERAPRRFAKPAESKSID